MALKITRAWRPYVPEFDDNRNLPTGEQISCEYRTMTIGDVFKVQDDTGVDMTQLDVQTNSLQTLKVNWELTCYVVETYTQNWKGIEVDGVALKDGKQIADVLGMPAMNLFVEIIGLVVSESMGSDVEEKNSDRQSGPESLDSGMTAVTVSPETFEKLGIAEVGS